MSKKLMQEVMTPFDEDEDDRDNKGWMDMARETYGNCIIDGPDSSNPNFRRSQSVIESGHLTQMKDQLKVKTLVRKTSSTQ